METQETTLTKSTEGKNIAIIAYITIIGLIIAFVMNNEKKDHFASYHIKQSLGLGLTFISFRSNWYYTNTRLDYKHSWNFYNPLYVGYRINECH